MKWALLLTVAAAGLHVVNADTRFEVADDVLILKTCSYDRDCIRRHNTARRAVLGAHRIDPVARYIPWTPKCPTDSWVAFQACDDARRP